MGGWWILVRFLGGVWGFWVVFGGSQCGFGGFWWKVLVGVCCVLVRVWRYYFDGLSGFLVGFLRILVGVWPLWRLRNGTLN